MASIKALGTLERTIASGIMDASSQLADEMKGLKQGAWDSGYLWDPRVLALRGHAGDLAEWLTNLRTVGDDLLGRVPAEMQASLKAQLNDVERLLARIHTDVGGEYIGEFQGISEYGTKLSGELAKIVKAADKAEASAAAQAAKGVTKLPSWRVVEAPGTSTTATKTVVEAAKKVQGK